MRETVQGKLSDRSAKTSTRREFLAAVAAFGAVAASRPTDLLRTSASAARATRPTALVYDDVSKSHCAGPGRRECPERYAAVLSALSASTYFPTLKPYQARSATDEEIFACHDKAYVAEARREIESGVRRLTTGDTYVCRQSLRAADYAAGAACVAVDAVLNGEAKNAFSLGRPPGHHATATRGMGFCIFNNASIAARYAQSRHGIGKVLIVDWDVHHGNGTQDIFYEDPSVFYFSTHQSPWYPWTGARDETGRGRGLGTTLNCPMKRGAGSKEFAAAFAELAAAANRFKPELVIISAGFDARHGDPLGRFELSDADYVDLTGAVLDIARHWSNGHLISILEGGYSLTGLASAATAHCGRLQRG